MKRILFLILVSFLLSSCATGYHSSGFSGGYKEFALDKDVYVVSYRGNGFTSADTTQAYLLRRCSELTLEKGYKYFLLVSGGTFAKSSAYQTPMMVSTNSTSNFYGNGYGGSGFYNFTGNGYSNSTTRISGGQTYMINKYTTMYKVKLLHSAKGYPGAMNAKIILSNFAQ